MKNLAIIGLLALMFISCGQKDDMKNARVSSLIGEKERDILNETGYPIVKKNITLSTIVKKRAIHGNFAEMPTLIRWQEAAGITLDIQEIERNQYGTKLNLLLASGDVPDVAMAEAPGNLLTYAGDLVMQLDPYIEKYMPHLSGILDQRPYYRKVMKEADGNIYSLISIEEFPEREVSYNLFINKKWLDKLGLDLPTTTDEFYQVLKAFKEQDPNGNGIRDEIPLTYEGKGGWDFVITNSGSFMDAYERRPPLIVEDGKVKFTPLAEPNQYIELIRYVQKLYQEGLIDQEIYTQGNGEKLAKGRAEPEIVGAFTNWNDENMVGSERLNDYQALPPLKGPEGRQEWVGYQRAFFRRGMTIVSTANPYPASTMRFLDMAYEPEFAWQIMYGPWDILLNKHADGSITVNPPPEGSGLSPDEWRFQNTPATRFPYGVLREQYDKFTGNTAQQRKIERAKIYKPYIDMSKYVPVLSFTPDEKTDLSVLGTDLWDYCKQAQVRWITEGTDPRSEWDTFTTTVKNIGLERYVEIFQTAYDRYMKE